MSIGLRTKVFLPLLILMALLIGYLYWNWMPRSLANMERQYQEATKRHLDSVVEGVIPLLLGRQLDTIYENFDALLTKNTDWKSIRLTDAAGRPIYPLENGPAQKSSTRTQNVRVLAVPISYLDMHLGTLTVAVDFSPHLSEWKREFYNAVSAMLAVIAVIVLSIGFVLERKVVRPVKTLEQAARELAQGKFSSMDLKAADDEMGHLVDSFDTMRENLATSYNLLRQSRDNYSTLYNETPVLLHSVDGTETIIEVNDFWLKTLGYQREEVLGKKATDFYTEASRKYAEETVRPAFLRDGFCRDIPYQFVKKNGDLVDVLLSATAERDEKGGIGRSFAVIVDITESKKIENELSMSEQKNRAISTTANDAIFMIDGNGCILFWNPAAENIFGYTAEEILGRYLPSILVVDSYAGDYEKELRYFSETGNGPSVGRTIELTARRKDGTEFPAELSLSALQMKDKWHAVGFVRDITQRKSAEAKILASLEEKKLLLQEIHHRVKNNMQVISSLLDLQLEYAENKQPREIFSEIKNRIISMSLVHEKLYRSQDLSKIDFHSYLSTLINNLYRFYNMDMSNVALRLDVKDIEFTIDTAIPCGLIVNELITNSLKYAFPGGRTGEVSVTLRHAGKGDDGKETYELTVKDNGIGIPKDLDLTKVKSLGLYLVRLLVKHQLGGTIDLHSEPGTEFAIRFKEVKYKKRI